MGRGRIRPGLALGECGLNASIVFLGVNFRVNTMGHFIEHTIAHRAVQRAAAQRRASLSKQLRGWEESGAWPAFDRLCLEARLDLLGLLSWARCGMATLLRVSARPMVCHAIRILEECPRAWFDQEFLQWRHKARQDCP